MEHLLNPLDLRRSERHIRGWVGDDIAEVAKLVGRWNRQRVLRL